MNQSTEDYSSKERQFEDILEKLSELVMAEEVCICSVLASINYLFNIKNDM